jgi:tetratricopeptide (TPR) repeat protein
MRQGPNRKSKSFFTTILPQIGGLLVGIAALITAVWAIIQFINGNSNEVSGFVQDIGTKKALESVVVEDFDSKKVYFNTVTNGGFKIKLAKDIGAVKLNFKKADYFDEEKILNSPSSDNHIYLKAQAAQPAPRPCEAYIPQIPNYKSALSNAIAKGDKIDQSVQHENLMVAYYCQGKFSQAIKELNSAIEVLRSDNSSQADSRRASIYYNLGAAYRDANLPIKSYAKAIDNFTLSLKMAMKISDKTREADNLNAIGDIYKRKGDCQKAIETLRKAHKIYKDLGNSGGMALVVEHLTECKSSP